MQFQVFLMNKFQMEPKQVLPLRVRVNQDVMQMKGYFTHSRAPNEELHYQMRFSFMLGTRICFSKKSFYNFFLVYHHFHLINFF